MAKNRRSPKTADDYSDDHEIFPGPHEPGQHPAVEQIQPWLAHPLGS